MNLLATMGKVSQILSQYKNQTPSFSLSRSKSKCQKPSVIIRSLKFGNKILIVGSLFYYTAKKGAWGTPEESREFLNHINEGIFILLPFHVKALFSDDK